MAIQSDETLVTKGDLKTLYTNKILPYLGGNMMMQTGVSDYYSEDEKVVGIWIDGKPLYQKTVSFTSLSSGQNPYQHNIQNAEYINFVPNASYIKAWGNTWCIYGASPTNSNYIANILDVSPVVVDVNIGSVIVANSTEMIITFQYTKTTDTASSTLTTPGCYDINRPDLWPNNKEIFFGNGLYGYKSTGVASSTSMKINAGITPVPTKIINHEVTIYGTNQTPVSSGYWSTNNFISGVYLSPQGELCFALCSDYVNKNYTVWVLYNK